MTHDAFRAPEVATYTVKRVVELAQKGKLRVPSFQRPLRWTPHDRQLLVDSIVRGYPIGTVLLWKKRGEAGPVRLGPLTFQGAEEAGALWVVDGQQRIVTLVAASLLGQDEPSFPAFGLFVDLDERRVFNDAISRRNQARYLPVVEAIDNVRLNQWVHEHGLAGDRLRAAFEIGDRLRSFEMPVITVETEDDAVLRVIFDRVNSGGKRLKADDIFSALHLAGTPSESLADLEREMEEQGRGKVSEAALHKSILAVLDIDPSRPLPRKLREPGGLSGKLPDVEKALSLALDFLVTDANIWRFELLPHALAFPILAKFFARHPKPRERNRMLLVRWLWRGLVHDVFQRGSEPLRKGLAVVDQHESASVQRLLDLVPAKAPPVGFAKVGERAAFKNARTKMTMLAMFAEGPADPFANEVVREPSDLVAAVFEAGAKLPTRKHSKGRSLLEMLPKAFPKSVCDDHPLFHSLANRLAMPHPGSQIDPDVGMIAMRQDFDNHSVPWPGDDFIASGYPAVLDHRVALLEQMTAGFVASLARWGESDRGPLDDDEEVEP